MTENTGYGCFEDDLPEERRSAEGLLEKLCANNAIEPSAGLKQKILSRLDFAGEELDLKDLPETNRYSNYLSWLEVIAPLMPKEPVETIFMQELRRDERIMQTLVISKIDVPEEMHEEYEESFFILEGRCTCTVGNERFTLNAGDHLDIPLHENHDVKILSPYVVAILQYRF